MPKLNSPAHRYLYLRFKRHLAVPAARLEARMESLFSFPVGLFHPLQHALRFADHSGTTETHIDDDRKDAWSNPCGGYN
jgi:hypothetical protein